MTYKSPLLQSPLPQLKKELTQVYMRDTMDASLKFKHHIDVGIHGAGEVRLPEVVVEAMHEIQNQSDDNIGTIMRHVLDAYPWFGRDTGVVLCFSLWIRAKELNLC